MVLSRATRIGLHFPSATPSVASRTPTSPIPGRMSNLKRFLKEAGAPKSDPPRGSETLGDVLGQSQPNVATQGCSLI